MSPIQTRLTVDLAQRSYDIHIGPKRLEQLGALIAPLMPDKAKQVAIITDETVYGHYGNKMKSVLDRYQQSWIVLPVGEAQKSMSRLEHVLDQLFTAGLDRSDMIIAFGGGVIGDLAGFAASVYKRGAPFIQVPTTLLAQVDSSVGGKTAINNRFGKNLIGAFYQPKLVLADTDVLSTLPIREIKAGYAEILKYGLLGDKPFFDNLDAGLGAQILALETQALSTAIAHSCAMKARIVAADERETGQRALLNLGHTFGHALELEAGYAGDLLHGEAVSAGMDMAFKFSQISGHCPPEPARRVSEHLQKLAMPCAADMHRLFQNSQALMKHMRQDKKNQSGAITLILAKDIGQSFIHKQADETALVEFWQSMKERSYAG